MKKILVFGIVTLFFLAVAAALRFTRPSPAVAHSPRPTEVAVNCTWTEVKICYAGVNNGCCPKPKEVHYVE